MKKVLLLGADGMLAHDVIELIKEKYKQYELYAYTSEELNILNKKDLYFRAEGIAPNIIINCAAFTNVDACESQVDMTKIQLDQKALGDIKQMQKQYPSLFATQINGLVLENLSVLANKHNAILAHVSTDYVFEGELEDCYITDQTNPINAYGYSKLLGEDNIQKHCRKYIIARTSWLYGTKGKNFIDTILTQSDSTNVLQVVHDQIGCPTFTKDLAEALLKLISGNFLGMHHASGEGSCSWADFARKILEFSGKECQVENISTEKSKELFPSVKANRPKNSCLINTIRMRKWEDALKEYVESRN